MKMKKRIIIILISFASVTMGCLLYQIYMEKIDTLYATMYGNVFGSYDICAVDNYLNNETVIVYKDMEGTYGELRKNVVSAFQKREYSMPKGSSYGNGYDTCMSKIREIIIQSYIISENHQSDSLTMKIERTWFIFFKVKSIQSDDEFFRYLFFGTDGDETDGTDVDGSNPHHAAIVSKVENGEIYYNAHTEPRDVQSLSDKLGGEQIKIIRIRDDAVLGYRL